MNSLNFIGRLTADPIARSTNDGKMVCNFSLALDSGKDKVDFPRCVAFDKNAEWLARFGRKGQRIGMSGHIHTDSYTDKDGKRVFTYSCVADRFDFADGKDNAEAPKENPKAFVDVPAGIDDDLPFA